MSLTVEVNDKLGSHGLAVRERDSARDHLPVIPAGLRLQRATTLTLLAAHFTPNVLRHFRRVAVVAAKVKVT